MTPEHRARLLDLVSLYVSQGQLAWGADGVAYAYDPNGRASWYVLETLKVWNGLLWWPQDLLGELLDLLEAKSFMAGSSGPAGHQQWTYEEFKQLQTRLSRHIEARHTYTRDEMFRRAASYQAKPTWDPPIEEDAVTLIKKRVL